MNRPGGQRGMTLLEILVALLLAGITVALASYLFMGAKAQMWLRGRESQMLREAVYLRSAMEDSLQAGGIVCEGEKLITARADGRLPPWTQAEFWRTRTQAITNLEIKCHASASDPEAEIRISWRAGLAYGKTLREVRGIWTP